MLFAKEPSEIEVIDDVDLEMADAYRPTKKLSPEGPGRAWPAPIQNGYAPRA